MALIFFRRRLTNHEVDEVVLGVETWFEKNPRRKVCKAQISGAMYKVRRGSVRKDIEKRNWREK